MVDYVDGEDLITENVLVQDTRWPGPLVVAGFVAFNTSQLVTKCLGRNHAGDVIERFLVFKRLDCDVPYHLMCVVEGDEALNMRRVLVTGLSEWEYLPRDYSGPLLPLPHSPLPFPLLYTRPGYLFSYDPSYCTDDEPSTRTQCSLLSGFILFIRSCF